MSETQEEHLARVRRFVQRWLQDPRVKEQLRLNRERLDAKLRNERFMRRERDE